MRQVGTIRPQPYAPIRLIRDVTLITLWIIRSTALLTLVPAVPGGKDYSLDGAASARAHHPGGEADNPSTDPLAFFSDCPAPVQPVADGNLNGMVSKKQGEGMSAYYADLRNIFPVNLHG